MGAPGRPPGVPAPPYPVKGMGPPLPRRAACRDRLNPVTMTPMPPDAAITVPAEPTTRRRQGQARERFTGRKVTPGELDRARAAGYESSGTDDWLIGRDPRRMAQHELRAMGHEPMSATAAIRARCLDCCGSPDEVRKCVATACPSWPWRMGTNPWRQPMSEEQREARRRQALEHGFGHSREGAQPMPSDELPADGPE
jgi:hypothetical protein